MANAGIGPDVELAVLTAAASVEAGEPLLGTMKPSEARGTRHTVTSQADRQVSAPKINGKPQPTKESRTPSATLYQAFKAYQKYLEREYHVHETEQVSPWGRIQIRQIKNLRKHHSDWLLTELDGEAISESSAIGVVGPASRGRKSQ